MCTQISVTLGKFCQSFDYLHAQRHLKQYFLSLFNTEYFVCPLSAVINNYFTGLCWSAISDIRVQILA